MYGVIKRLFDIVVAGVGLIVLSPVIALTAVAVRASLASPVLFRQQRPGLGGRPFGLVKFRTMRTAIGPDGAELPDGDRLTPFGARLRSLSLDELPTLWNVLTGDMSLVGPRPLLMEYLPLYSPVQSRRHEVRPGITGWAQVHGRNDITWERRLELDVWYVDHRSVVLDMVILWKTVSHVLFQRGISEPGQATKARFTGSPRH
jgi:lipopolysaccharide/colanic/teichoic acid biosynthesis glycosyltransferase